RILPIGQGDPCYRWAACTPQVRNGSQSLSPERAKFGKLDAATDELVPSDARGISSMCDRPNRLLAVLLMLVATLPLIAQSLPDQTVKRLEASIRQTMRDQKIPGFAIGIVKGGRLVYSGGFGVMHVGNPDRPVTAQTLFHMASITKPFVATALMQLVEK